MKALNSAWLCACVFTFGPPQLISLPVRHLIAWVHAWHYLKRISIACRIVFQMKYLTRVKKWPFSTSFQENDAAGCSQQGAVKQGPRMTLRCEICPSRTAGWMDIVTLSKVSAHWWQLINLRGWDSGKVQGSIFLHTFRHMNLCEHISEMSLCRWDFSLEKGSMDIRLEWLQQIIFKWINGCNIHIAGKALNGLEREMDLEIDGLPLEPEIFTQKGKKAEESDDDYVLESERNYSSGLNVYVMLGWFE